MKVDTGKVVIYLIVLWENMNNLCLSLFVKSFRGIGVVLCALLSVLTMSGNVVLRFYRTPYFRTAVREVLLRAALCDHNERAQELCDSLGFSICDYRLPVSE